MRVCSLLSGGKDSNYSLYKALVEGHEVSCIVVVTPESEDSWMFHSSNTWLAKLQAESMGLGHLLREVRVSGVKEREVDELLQSLRRIAAETGFDAIALGAVASTYQRTRFKRIADSLGVGLYAPMWGADQEEYLVTLVREGFRFIITQITTMGLPRELIGVPVGLEEARRIIQLSRLHGFNPSFEGGEAETLVIDAPHYRKRICLEGFLRSRGEYEHYLTINSAWLEDKPGKCQPRVKTFNPIL